MIHKGVTKDHTVPHRLSLRTIPSHTIPYHTQTIYSREDPRPLMTVSSTIMIIVVHFTKVSTMYPCVVISSLTKQLENLLFATLYTSFGVWPRDHYMLLQMFTTRVCHALLRFPHQGFSNTCPSCTMWIPG
jgi:hypothetical protein